MTQYRPDIDGLRAVAVLAVLFFHAGFPFFTGGFVGVDIFFVISGYLITTILRRSIERNQFSIADFYRRRALRILPAYTAMSLFSTAVAIWLLPPSLLTDFANSLLASALFGANFYFAGQMNYFQAAAEELPLLHMWSLGVEEQFYLLWPLALLFLCLRRLRSVRLILIGLGVLAGVGLCEWAVRNKSQTMVFFYTPFRAWELLIGAFIALAPLPRVSARWCLVAALVGLGLIFGAVFLFQPGRPLFPGISGLAPCLGAALLIVSGAVHTTFVHRLLAQKTIVFIGLISYSLYLWHWPLFAFARYLNQGYLSNTVAVGLSLASVLIAYLSWKYIESPFRKHDPASSGSNNVSGSRWQIKNCTSVLATAAGAIIFTSITAGVLLYYRGLPTRASALALQASAALKSSHSLTPNCLRERAPDNIAPHRERCVFGELSKKPTVALWGDSHANAFVPALEQKLKSRGKSFELLAMQSCSPILIAQTEPDAGGRGVRACDDFNRAVIQYLSDSDDIRVVYVSSYWTSKYNLLRSGIGDSDLSELGGDTSDAVFRELVVEKVIRPLTDAGKAVVLVGQPPEFKYSGGRCLARKAFLNQPLSDCDQEIEQYLATTGKVNALLQGIVGAQFVDVTPAFCDADKCTPYPNHTFAFRDEHHLSVPGALLLANQPVSFPLE